MSLNPNDIPLTSIYSFIYVCSKLFWSTFHNENTKRDRTALESRKLMSENEVERVVPKVNWMLRYCCYITTITKMRFIFHWFEHKSQPRFCCKSVKLNLYLWSTLKHAFFCYNNWTKVYPIKYRIFEEATILIIFFSNLYLFLILKTLVSKHSIIESLR